MCYEHNFYLVDVILVDFVIVSKRTWVYRLLNWATIILSGKIFVSTQSHAKPNVFLDIVYRTMDKFDLHSSKQKASGLYPYLLTFRFVVQLNSLVVFFYCSDLTPQFIYQVFTSLTISRGA